MGLVDRTRRQNGFDRCSGKDSKLRLNPTGAPISWQNTCLICPGTDHVYV